MPQSFFPRSLVARTARDLARRREHHHRHYEVTDERRRQYFRADKSHPQQHPKQR